MMDKNKQGFHSNGMKKLLVKSRWNYAYVYRDGIVLNEKREFQCGSIGSGKIRFTKDFTHIMASDIPIYFTSGTNESFIGRLVFHNPTLLADGVKRIEIYLNNSSESMKRLNITCNTVKITTQSGMEIEENIFPWLSSDITIQNDGKKSIMNFDSYEAIWHGVKPESSQERGGESD